MAAILRLENCRLCPYLRAMPDYTCDSWERPIKWMCKKRDDKIIARYIERTSEEPKDVPEWCPLREENNED
jgi:hypothetical protein